MDYLGIPGRVRNQEDPSDGKEEIGVPREGRDLKML